MKSRDSGLGIRDSGTDNQPFVIPGPHPAVSDAKPRIHLDPAPVERTTPGDAKAESRLKRLQWRCRRGTRELDALLGGWLEAHRALLEEPQFDAFDALLDQQDPALWDWLMGHAEAPRADWRAIITDIRERAGLSR